MSDEAATWHTRDSLAVADELSVDIDRGLSDAEAERRLAQHGPNAVPEPPPKNPLVAFFGQFADPLVGALLVAAVVAAAVAASGQEGGSWTDAIAILTIVILNAALGFFQERRAESALSALRRIAALRAKVLRGGKLKDLDAQDLVPGDVIELDAGDAVPADARLITARDLAVEEAALTGESLPVPKNVDPTEESAPVADRKGMIFTGTTATRGHARGVIVATGVDTELGRIGALLSDAKRTPTPLEVRLGKLGRAILVACVLISALVFAIGMVRDTGTPAMLLLIAVSLAVAAIPEGLPAITTITLALGMQRMAGRGAIVRKLPAVETLGSATVICSDKTGTLTQNAMTVRVVETAEGTFDVSGEGYASTGDLSREGDILGELPDTVRRLMTVCALCNTAAFQEKDGVRRVVGDPTEGALLVLATKGGVNRMALLADAHLTDQRPFDSDRKRMSVVLEGSDGTRRALVKGAPDSILARATHERTGGGELRVLDDDRRTELSKKNAALANRAFRVLALAERDDPDPDDPEAGLTFLGFAAMLDPPRPEAKVAVTECHRAGIAVTMITGDHKLTAIAIAESLGIWTNGAEALTGAELLEMDDEALESIIDDVRVFARVTAEQKLRIVEILQGHGHVVAMTGDGVNDAPALKRAAIGVAMGRSGTDVARQSSEMVLADDRFSTIVEAVREGRAIFADIQKFIFFLGSSNAGLVFFVLAMSFFDSLPGLSPLMLLWINLVTNGLPALALGVDPAEPGQMKRGPRPPAQGIVGWRDFWGVVLVGGIMCTAALSLYALAASQPELFAGETRAERMVEARTMAFMLLALSPLFHSFNCRSPTESVWTVGWGTNRFLWIAIGISGLLQVVTVIMPAARGLFVTQSLTAAGWAVVLGFSLLPVPIVEALKLADRSRRAQALKPRGG